MASIVDSKTQLILEVIVAIILALFVTYAPGMVGTVISTDSQLAPFIPVLVAITYIVAYELLSKEGYAKFQEILGQLKGTGLKSNDKGEMSPLAYLFVVITALVVTLAFVGIVYYGVDGLALLLGAAATMILGYFGLAATKSKTVPGVTLKDGFAQIDWALFDKSRVKVQAVPEGLLNIVFTANGHSWTALDCRYNPADGYIYSLKADPTADNAEGMKNDVYLAMDKLTAPAALDYIIEKIAGKGWDTKLIKAVLVLGQSTVDRMINSNTNDYQDYVDGLNQDVNLDKGWASFKQRDEYFLRRIADDLYYKYYKGAV
jgi:hypothetical protein